MFAGPRFPLGILLLAGCIGGCAVPTRDNPFDPQLAPVVSLTVAAEDANGLPTASTEGNRNTRFTLDARASVDHDGDPIDDFSWDLDGDGVFERDDAGLLEHLEFPITLADLPEGAGGVARTVRVEGRAKNGARGIAAGQLVVRNSAPAVELGEEMYTSPFRGYTVVLDPCAGSADCLSKDPDLDALSWTWQQVGGPDVALVPAADGTASFSAPLAVAMLVFEATASDGLATARDRVVVRTDPALWLQTANPMRTSRFHAGNGLERVFSTVVDINTAPGAPAVSVAVDASTGDIWLATSTAGQITEVRRDPSITGTPDETWSIDAGAYDVYGVVAAGSGAACARGFGLGTIFRLDPALPPIEVTIPSGVPRLLLGEPGAGTCLVMTATNVFRIAAGGIVTSLQVTPPLDDPKSAHVAPDGSLWVLEKAGASTGTTGFAARRIVRVGAGGVRAVILDSADHMFDQMCDYPDGGFWIHTVGSENALYRLFDDGTLEPTNAPETPPMAPGDMFSDVVTRSVYLFDYFGGRVVRFVDRDGVIESVDTVTPSDVGLDESGSLALNAFDPYRGVLYFSKRYETNLGGGFFQYDGLLASVPESFLLHTEIPAGGRRFPSVDGTRGAAWTTADGSDAYRLERWSPAGRLLATVFPKTHGRAFSSEPDGSLWTIEIHRSVESPPAGSDAVRHYGIHGELLEELPFANGSNALLDAYEGGACGAIERSSFSGFGGDGLTRLFRVTATGGAIDLEQVAQVAEPACMLSVSASPGGDCWFLMRDDCQITDVSTLTYEPLSGAPVVTNVDLEGEIHADPRGVGVWNGHAPPGSGTQPFRVQHLSAAGATLGEWTRLEEQEVALDAFDVIQTCDGTSPECVDVWIPGGDPDGTRSVRRADAVTGTSLQSFSLPGVIERMDGSR